MKKTLIWLDDCRDPFYGDWIKCYSPIGIDVDIIWCQSFDEFEKQILENGLPDAICFDHDLGEDSYDERTGYDAANLIVNYCIDNHKALPKWNIQSSNPVGAENIRCLLINAAKYI